LRSPVVVILGVIAALVLALAPHPAGASPSPSNTAFFTYDGSAPLSSYAPGAVLKTRVIRYHLLDVPTPIKVVQILYRTTDQQGRPSANVTSVMLPATGRASRAISYQSAYDSNSIADAPSRSIAGDLNLTGITVTAETAAMATFLGAGFAVIVPDDEGADSALGMGRQAGYATLDSMRAALNAANVTGLSPDTRIGMLGYSGGAIPTGWAAQLQPEYAPELTSRMVGAAYGGVAVDLAHNFEYVAGSPFWSVALAAVLGAGVRSYGVDVDQFANAYGKRFIAWSADKSIAYNAGLSIGLTWQKMVMPQYANPNSVPAFVQIVNDLNMGLAPAPTMPVLMAQGGKGILNGTKPSKKWGDGDGVMLVKDARTLVRGFCTAGTKVLFREYPKLEHAGAGVALVAEAVPWLFARFDGTPAPSNCGTVPAGNSLAPEVQVPVGTPAG
jgi:hypothetical protein